MPAGSPAYAQRHDTVQVYLNAAVANGGTISVPYPAGLGRAQASYDAGGAPRLSSSTGINTASGFSVAYGASAATLTWSGGRTLPAGTTLWVQLPLRRTDGDAGAENLQRVLLGDGLVGAPALAFEQDSDTGLYRPAANEMAVAAGGTQVWRATAGGLLLPGQPLFQAYLAATVADQTGDGTYYNIAGYTELRDVGSNFNPTTGVFVAPVTGTYRFDFGVTLEQLGSASRVEILLLTSNRNYYARYAAPGAISGFAAYGGYSIETDMDAGDDAKVQVMATGTGAKTADVYGAATTTHWTYFNGRLVG